jgi:nicotinamidase-related amidase
MKCTSLHLAAAIGLVAAAIGLMPAAQAADVIAEWASVKAPPPPPVKAVTVDPKTTALLMLDFLKQNCGKRPRCVADVPAVAKLLDAARAAKATVIYSYFPKHGPGDILDKRLDPVAGEGSVTSTADKFLNTDLDKMLKDKGIKTVVIVGTAANGAVLCTGTDAGLRGYQVIIPVDGIGSADAYSEQFSTWQLANGPTFGNRVTITRTDMVKF